MQVQPFVGMANGFLTNESSNLALSRSILGADLVSFDSHDHQRISIYSNVIGKCHYLEAAVARL